MEADIQSIFQKSKIIADIDEFNEISAHGSDNIEDSEGKRRRGKGENKEENESDSGKDEDWRDSGYGEMEDPLSLPICVRDIFVESCGLTTWMDDLAYPRESTMNKVLQNGKTFHFKVWIYEVFPHLGRYAAEVADEDKDLGGHNYVQSSARAYDQAGSSGLKNSPDASNDDGLCERVTLLEKAILNIAFFIRGERLRRIVKNKKKQRDEELEVVVTDIAALDEKVKEEKKEEETEEEKAVYEQDEKYEEE
ncbi:hypothetical protein FXO38_08664 [Capsicum annuum]|nr:hypothetical protein FXO38_08664 [Capsicum annuum]